MCGVIQLLGSRAGTLKTGPLFTTTPPPNLYPPPPLSWLLDSWCLESTSDLFIDVGPPTLALDGYIGSTVGRLGGVAVVRF